MTLDLIRKKIQDLIASGLTPRTILMTPEDAKKLNLPTWTRQLLGLKLVIAGNYPETVVTPHFYESIEIRKQHPDEPLIKIYK